MATARKTSSGMWKVRVYSHTTPDGKKHYRAFTAPTKQEAEQAAARFSGTADRAARVDLTVLEAIHGYITAKTGVLSPATIRGYRQMEKNYYTEIGSRRLRKLTSADVQLFVSNLAQRVSPKTTMNIYGLLTSAAALYAPEIVWRVKLPQKDKKRAQSATGAEIMALYNAADGQLKIAIGLSAFGSLRRGEICALTYGDITDGVIYVHSDMVRNESGKWIKKPIPKTLDSVRYVSTVPAIILDLIPNGPADENIITTNPNEITKAFCRLRDALGIKCRFQDLRGFFASTAPVLGIGDIYLADFGGWKRGSSVIREHYMKSMESVSKEYAKKMRDYFDALLNEK